MPTQVILNFDTLEEFSRIFAVLKDMGLEQKIQVKTKSSKPAKAPFKPRQAGWGKGIFAYVAPDFDETPPGFEEYSSENIPKD